MTTRAPRQRLRPLLRELAERERTLREEIARELEEVDALRTSEFEERVGDRADHAEAQVSVAVENRRIDRQLDEMQALSAARERIENGTFGVCADCGEPIGDERMAALPTASRCAPCQSRRERLGARMH